MSIEELDRVASRLPEWEGSPLRLSDADRVMLAMLKEQRQRHHNRVTRMILIDRIERWLVFLALCFLIGVALARLL